MFLNEFFNVLEFPGGIYCLFIKSQIIYHTHVLAHLSYTQIILLLSEVQNRGNHRPYPFPGGGRQGRRKSRDLLHPRAGVFIEHRVHLRKLRCAISP